MSGVSATFFSKNSIQDRFPLKGTQSPKIWINNLIESQKEAYNNVTLQKYIYLLQAVVKEIETKEFVKRREVKINFLEEPLSFVLDLFYGALNKIYQAWNKFSYRYEIDFSSQSVQYLNILKAQYTAITEDYSNVYQSTDGSSPPTQPLAFAVHKYQEYSTKMASCLKEPVQVLTKPQLDCLTKILSINTSLKKEDLFFLLHKVLLVDLQNFSCQKENCFVLTYSSKARTKIEKMGLQNKDVDCFHTYFCREKEVTLQITEMGMKSIKGLSSEKIETSRYWIRPPIEKVISKPNFISFNKDSFEYEISEGEQTLKKEGSMSNLKAYLCYWKPRP